VNVIAVEGAALAAVLDVVVCFCYFVLALLSVVGGTCEQPKWDVPLCVVYTSF
jgi:hypothetical protein